MPGLLQSGVNALIHSPPNLVCHSGLDPESKALSIRKHQGAGRQWLNEKENLEQVSVCYSCTWVLLFTTRPIGAFRFNQG